MKRKQFRTYKREECIVFHKTDDPFGGLSNMAGGYPIYVSGICIRTSEALYQACRFPHLPEVQNMIIHEGSPITAKRKTKQFIDDSRPDWYQVRINIMRWCLKMKLMSNSEIFGSLLLSTDDKTIVEESYKDEFWGAKPSSDGGTFIGMNVLGRLLMELREQIKDTGLESFQKVKPPNIEGFNLFNTSIKTEPSTDSYIEDSFISLVADENQQSLFD